MDAAQAAQNALQCVLDAKEGDRLVIFCDDTRAAVGEAFERGALNLKLSTKLVLLETSKSVFRKELTSSMLKYVTEYHADIYINLFRGVREETPFRIKLIHLETADHETRLGHCPGVTIDMLTKGALALSVPDHRKMQTFAQALMKKLQNANRLELSTPAGTGLSFDVEGRPFFTDTMMDWVLMKWMNLPTGEAIVAPVENSLEGTLVCDLAIGGIGPIKTPVILRVKGGKVQKVSSQDADVLRRVQASLDTDSMSSVVGEFALGINPKARFVDEFLETEKIHGTVHIAFGDNTDFPGGKNDSGNHMDFLMDKPTVKAIMKNGDVDTLVDRGIFQPLKP
jgi:hypothetical protein